MRTEMSTTSLNQAPTVRAVALLGNPGRTRPTGAKNIDDVLRVPKAMVSRNLFSPGFHCGGFYLRGLSALSANQMVMMTGGAGSIEVFTLETQRVSASLFC